MSNLFEIEQPINLPVFNSDISLPIRKIYCVGRNYVEHAKEMSDEVSRDVPFFFIKSSHDVILSGSEIEYPAGTSDLHYELELAVIIDKKLKNVDAEEAKLAIFGYAVGLDLTKRDLQTQLKNQSLPWALSKSFSQAAVLSPVNINTSFENIYTQTLVLKQNNQVRQNSLLGEMVWKIEELIAYLSTLDTLYPGDVIFTGTPSGVGAVERGDKLKGSISGVGELDLTVLP